MKTTYADTMTMREARARYFDVNEFGADGGYDEPWVDFKLGPIPMPFPNSKARVRAVRFHDIHHILTGYDTDIRGEFEISAWEIGAGCKDFVAAWALNLGGMAGGLFTSPRRTLAAFVRGRRESTAYGADLDSLLDLTVAEARARFAPLTGQATPKATVKDLVLFALATEAGLAVGTLQFALFLPLVPFGLIAHAIRRRAAGERA